MEDRIAKHSYDDDGDIYSINDLINDEGYKIDLFTIDEAVKYSDTLCDYVNSQFNDFVKNNFLCQPNFLNFNRQKIKIIYSESLWKV